MKIGKFEYQVLLKITLTKEELTLLIKESEQHYDAYCRMVSRPGPGAFLNGWKTLMFNDPETEIVTHQGELDTCLKILENSVEGRQLYLQIMDGFKSIGTEWRRVNS